MQLACSIACRCSASDEPGPVSAWSIARSISRSRLRCGFEWRRQWRLSIRASFGRGFPVFSRRFSSASSSCSPAFGVPAGALLPRRCRRFFDLPFRPRGTASSLSPLFSRRLGEFGTGAATRSFDRSFCHFATDSIPSLLSRCTEDLGADCIGRRPLLSAGFFFCRRGMVSAASAFWSRRLGGFDAVKEASLPGVIFCFRAMVWSC